MTSVINDIPDFLGMAEALKKDLITYAEVTGENFFKDSFQNQGFTNRSFEAWEHRKNDFDPGRAILTSTGYLRDSIRVISSSENQIVYGTDASYAAIHNEGGVIKINISKKMRKYFWYMFKATGVSRWKWMALTKKQEMTINIPKRQFIGESQQLLDTLDNWVITQINTRFKQL